MLLSVGFYLGEDVLKGSRHDTLVNWIFRHARNGECLSSSGLPVGEDRTVVAGDDVLTDWIGSLSKDVCLFRAVWKKRLEGWNG